jgi:hypothetical protein
MRKRTEEFSDSQLDELAERADGNPRLSAHETRSLIYTARQLALQRRYLARLASDTPQFSNPMDVYAIQKLRDEVLALDVVRRSTPQEK